jgi:hypothetical protein
MRPILSFSPEEKRSSIDSGMARLSSETELVLRKSLLEFVVFLS